MVERDFLNIFAVFVHFKIYTTCGSHEFFFCNMTFCKIHCGTAYEYPILHQVFCTAIFYGCSPGPRLNIKTVLSTYGDFHVKDKTAVRTSYL